MRIKEITDERILFDDGSEITYDHHQDCCECNYADFRQLSESAMDVDFEKEYLIFESVDGYGFRFGSHKLRMFFVPCYSDQNGYYSSDVDIYYNGQQVLNLLCEERFC